MTASRSLCLALLLLVSVPGLADIDPTDVTLNLSRHALGLDYPQAVDSRQNQAVVSVIEREYRYLHGGFRLGVTSLTQSGNPATAGLRLEGGTGGILLRAPVPVTGPWGVLAETSYDFHHLSAEDDASRLTVEWFEFTARAGPSLQAGPLGLTVGGLYRHVDGDQLLRNGVDATERLDAERPWGAFLRLRYRVDADGWVGLRGELGSRAGGTLFFTRRY